MSQRRTEGGPRVSATDRAARVEERASRRSAGSALDALIDAQPTSDRAASPVVGAVLGHLAGIDAEGRVLFLADGAGTALAVAIGLPVADGVVARAARTRQRALAVRANESADDWVLVGLVRDRIPARLRRAGPGDVEIRVDGDKLVFEAERSIELRCGDASLTLRKDGRIVLSGDYVVSESRGPNKIRGATISLN